MRVKLFLHFNSESKHRRNTTLETLLNFWNLPQVHRGCLTVFLCYWGVDALGIRHVEVHVLPVALPAEGVVKLLNLVLQVLQEGAAKIISTVVEPTHGSFPSSRDKRWWFRAVSTLRFTKANRLAPPVPSLRREAPVSLRRSTRAPASQWCPSSTSPGPLATQMALTACHPPLLLPLLLLLPPPRPPPPLQGYQARLGGRQ